MIKYLFAAFCLCSSFLALAQKGTVKGSVTTSDGAPVEFVTVGLKGTSTVTTTGNDGTFELKNVPVGTYTLIVRLFNEESLERSINVEANTTTNLNDLVLKGDSKVLQEVVIILKKGYLQNPQETTGRMNLDPLENPQSVQVIGQQIIKDRQIQSVGEATKSMAGINAFSSSQYSDYVMRGFRTSPGNFAYNGIRGDFFQFDQAALTYNIESIEAIKGPASVLYSAGNPGGIINHVTKKALAAPRYELQYTFGSFDQHRIMADATGAVSKNRKLLYRLVLGYENTGQLDENLKIQNVFVAPQLHYNFSEKTSLNYEFNFGHDQRTMGFNRGTPALFNAATNDWTLDRFPNTTSLIDPNGTSLRNTFSHQVKFLHAFTDKVKLTVLYRSVLSNTFQADLSPGGWGVGATNDSIELENRYWKEDLYNHQLSAFVAIGSPGTKKIQNRLVAGLDANIGGRTAAYAGFESRRVAVMNPEFGWGYYNEADINHNMASATYQSGWNERTVLLAAYVQDQIKIGNKLSFLLGGRFESHNFMTDYFDLANGSETFRDSLTANQFLPRAGVVYNPTPSTAVYYGYSQGFIPQWGSNTASGGPFPPEKSRQHEVGVKKEWLSRRLMTTLAVYHIQKYDVLAPDPTDSNGLRMVQIDNVYSKGIEISVQGRVTNGLDVIVNYSYNEATTPGDSGYDGFPGGWFPNAPNTNANLWAKYTVKKGTFKNLGAGAGFNYLSKRTTYTPGFEIPAFTTVDASLSYTIKGLSFAANLYNLTNTVYWNGAYGPSNLWPGNPRSFRLTVGYVF